MFRTASDQKVAHEGMRTIECSIEYGSTRRLTCAVTSVQKILFAAEAERHTEAQEDVQEDALLTVFDSAIAQQICATLVFGAVA